MPFFSVFLDNINPYRIHYARNVNVIDISCCNMNALLSFDLFMVYIPESKQQLRSVKEHMQIREIAHFKSGL